MIFETPLSYEDWLRWRELGLGGSDAGTIMGVSKWETRRELWERRTNRLAPKAQTWAMRRGIELEDDAREEYQRITGIAMPKQLGIHDGHEWLRASFDGYSRNENRAIEIKCPGADDHRLACEGKIPPHYLWQLVHLCLVADIPVVDYVSYNEHTLAIIPFERNLLLEGRLIKAELQFWQCIVNDTPPPEDPPGTEPRPRRADSFFKVRRSR